MVENLQNPNLTPFEALPLEVTTDILSRLPSKPLHLSKCVCKEWYTLIKSTNFIKYYHLKNPNNLMLIINNGDSLSSFDLDEPVPNGGYPETKHIFPNHGKVLYLAGTCNGLVCFINFTYDDECECFVYNPFTRYMIKIPVSEKGLAFFGFGYDSFTSTYKIIKIHDPFGHLVHRTELFSFKSNSWRKIESFPYKIDYFTERCVFTNNALHWHVFGGYRHSHAILAFDFRSENYNLVPLPNEYDGWKYMDIEVFEGDLSLQVLDLSCGKPSLDLWVMREYGVKESWTKLFRFPYMGEFNPDQPINMKGLAYSKTGDKVLFQQDSKYYWYDFEGETIDTGVVMHLNSLVCLRSIVSPAMGDQQLGNMIGSGDDPIISFASS